MSLHLACLRSLGGEAVGVFQRSMKITGKMKLNLDHRMERGLFSLGIMRIYSEEQKLAGDGVTDTV